MNNRISLSYKVMVIGITAVLLVALLGAFAGGIMFAPYVSGNAQAAPALPAVEVPLPAAQASGQSGDILAAYEEALT
ncbi:MAG: hypothetical protein HYR94_26860, partial [Chloroflexi bacterium]|nr:hypothetical protein [Chloroflexota bacterium]